MADSPLYVVDIIGQIVQAVDAVLFPTLGRHIFYCYGRSVQIQNKIQGLAGSKTQKDDWWPMVALFMDFPEQTGTGYYAIVKFPKISIATVSKQTDDPVARYINTFKPTLYKIYGEFRRQITKHPNVVGNDPGALQMIKWDRPGSQPEGGNLNLYLDAIELQNLELTLKTVRPCGNRHVN